MFVKTNNIPPNLSGIYKINYPNGKSYIGLSCDIKRRMWEHFNPIRKNHKLMPCDAAILKYGIPDEIEILEEVHGAKQLQQREIYWIKYYQTNKREKGYNLTSGGEAHYREDNYWSILSEQEVMDIRKLRADGLRKIDAYQNYKNKISMSGFEKIWLGVVSPDTGKEYLDKMKRFTKKELCGIANQGELSAKAKLKTEDVLKIRKRYSDGELPKEIWKDYPFVSLVTIKRVCYRQTWKHI